MKQKIGIPVNFKKAKIPSKKNLNGKYVVLEPINITKHSKDLYANFSKDKENRIWTYLPYGPFKTYVSFKNGKLFKNNTRAWINRSGAYKLFTNFTKYSRGN